VTAIASPTALQVADVVHRFVAWLDGFGETSLDHQTFFAGRVGGAAKRLYYEHPKVGIAAVAPIIFCEAFVPSSRRFFYKRVRFPIADAHFAMGFGFLYETTGRKEYRDKAVHFLEALVASRCQGFKDYCWGYPFDWVTRNGTIPAQTPLVTTTPYVFEAFHQMNVLEPRKEWTEVLTSIAHHAATDIKDFPVSATASSCSYTPYDCGGVINAAAYRSAMLTSAARLFDRGDYWNIAERNLNFVLENQNQDGSWHYAVDGVRDFVDHFHTCFVMKALAKVHALTGHEGCRNALASGLKYYMRNLLDDGGLPKPFAKAPRLTVYKRELYDCAESINLCLLLRDRFPECQATLDKVVAGIVKEWVKPDGSFRSRQLFLGWDNVPMHRWAQSQMFRSLAFWWREASLAAVAVPAMTGRG
jgi:hypothetical protein